MTIKVISIDASQGEGGGQILRTALSLSACTGKAVCINNIRSARKKPGLMRQHLACVKAMATICNAELKGASIGSKKLLFIPSKIQAGEYSFSIASAGSSCLLFQTLLPALLFSAQTSTLTFEGGTHNPMAPSFDFIRHAFLPQLEKMGLGYEISITQYGFYPAGGGRWSITINPPAQYDKLTLLERGVLLNLGAQCLSSGIPAHIIQREKKQLIKRTGWSEQDVVSNQVPAIGSGNTVIISAQYESVCHIADHIGSIGVTAEKVASLALNKLRKYQSAQAPVGEFLADQLLLPLVVSAGGSFITGKLSTHTQTNIEVIKQMCDVDISVTRLANRHCWRINVGSMQV